VVPANTSRLSWSGMASCSGFRRMGPQLATRF
jgi:hypothetical protein